MPSKSPKQAKLMRICAHPSGQQWAKTKKVRCP